MFGPGVTIMAGNHNTSVVGRAMWDVGDKRPIDDQPVVIEDDVWVGAGAIILKGVTIGRGAVVGAGAVVSVSVRPYTVLVGDRRHKVGERFTHEEAFAHETALYAPGQRLPTDALPTPRVQC